jgi:hypothetical protein
MIDLISELRRMQSKTNLEGFNRYVDSLEAISDGLITYMGFTDRDGDAGGMTINDSPLEFLPSYAGQLVKVLDGDAAGQTRVITSHAIWTLTVDAPFTDAAGAAVQIMTGTAYVIISRLSGGADHGDIDFLEGFPHINEAWEPANIDLNIWTPTHPATNPLVVSENAAPNVGYSVVEFNIEDAETARLIGRASVNRWRVVPTLMGVNHAVKQFLMEWEIYFHNLAHIDAANMFMGLVTTPADTLVSNNIVGFGVTLPPAFSVDTITDNGGGRLLMGSGILATLEDVRVKLSIRIDENNVYFYINEILAATHPAAGTLPDQLMYPCWYMPSAGGGADDFEFYLGAVRIGYVDIP